MKRLLVVLLAFFFMAPNVLAEGTIKSVDVNVSLDAKGVATVTESWNVERQDIQFLEKTFTDIEGVEITDFNIVSARNLEIKSTDSWDKTKVNTYYLKDMGDKKKLLLAVDGENDTYTLSYKVKGMVVDFIDAEGIEWYFVPRNTLQKIGTYTAHITSPYAFDANNTALYAIGSSDLEVSLNEGGIYIITKNVQGNYPIKIMTTFNGIKFSEPLARDYAFQDRYDSEKNFNSITEQLRRLITSEIAVIFFIIIGIIVAILFIRFIYKTFKKHDEYSGIIIENKEAYNKIDNAPYYDATPCNGDLYKIAFIAGYFKLLKNRSDLIGAILLKWDFENFIEIHGNNENPHIFIKTGQYFDNNLDYDLYKILSSCATQGYLSGSKLIHYAEEHYLRVMAWFNMGHHDTLNNELNRGNIKRVKKFKKYVFVLEDPIIEDAIKLAGLKKYLLHFNQVPRQTELTMEGYKYLLILAELLGIGDQVSKEILRKNPDNDLAKKLLELQNVKHIYKNVYSQALGPYKQVVKDNGNSSYDPELEKIVNRDDEATKNRRL